ncbi:MULTISPECIES: chromosome segregation protein SMC [Thiorhodovibrio]|uniref:chromosome segregation protein SMC n=1 Tax=Thiorhodovibrio TaxID=61593 RepID=UPI0019117377|nr:MULTISPECIES: chromosome segregation protein SMC [Thiorhodovibrio]MBK5967809.1 chromosome segregation protein SMC [Thiorhodovibrio winogradskyi]WPL14385.1 Chromosome partition protein Smc [Thiorhodovibrio litoralis]
MRLEKIKIAGFKSFVDPTTVPFPSNLVGVVGPNGCGKSNVIDAVRWVMGESSAKMLRGESMADVIFNGSTGRKPVGQATIELIFDNSDGGAGGAFAAFGQISVKRQVSRDGQSNYYLNGSRCRRRDIQDLFLGTGLGPRSYSIIEQGMISRFVEARPEDLRLFIEEAAGISKYKERRRETETRMRHTRENLERLEDVREEVTKQLAHLERQAATAEKYRQLRGQEEDLKAQLAALHWRDLDTDITARERALAAAENALEANRAEQRACEAEIERLRAAHADASEQFNQVQGQYYAVGSEIARLEQAISFARESRSRQQSELSRVEQELADATQLGERDRSRLTEIDDELARDQPQLEDAREHLEGLAEQLEQSQEALDAVQQQWDELQGRVSEPAQQAQLERGRINQLEQRLAQDQQRVERLQQELERLNTAELEARLEHLAERSEGLDERISLAADAQTRASEQLRQAEEERRTLAGRLDAARTELQSARGRQSSLEALQESALASDDEARANWLDEQGLHDAPRLIDLMEVTQGWETAVEVALAQALAAVGSADFARHAEQAAGTGLMLFDRSAQATVGASDSDRLLARIKSDWPLDGLLEQYLCEEDLPAALARRSQLAPGERIVTRDGTLVARDWVQGSAADGQGMTGSLARAEELKRLQTQTEELEDVIADLAEQQSTLGDNRQQLEREREAAMNSVTQLSRERASLDAEVGAGRARLEHLRERGEALAGELEELAERREGTIEELEDARERLNAALEASEQVAAERDQCGSERDRLRTALASARAEDQQARSRVAELTLNIETRRASREAIAANIERAAQQLAQLSARREDLRAELEAASEPEQDARDKLETQLERRLEVEGELSAARTQMEQLNGEVGEQEQERHRLEQANANAQADLAERRVQLQERLVRRRTFEEQLGAEGKDAQRVLEGIDSSANAEQWQQRLNDMGSKISRLGNINLAAIDEFQEQSERLRYLEDQHQDIQSSLDTLESAIRKIDRETRTRFKETFDQINSGLQALFPRLFGGGNAYLELTDEDLLETGVAIMARPPGKRNASIHLLSGGEKALTAVALVFAIFELNPAPFCLLDEVDAPLDDANVTRFCQLVREMSNRTQFIFISHNKVTMEIADQLIGVTMHEPGVSRLVSVDIDDAARLAGAS